MLHRWFAKVIGLATVYMRARIIIAQDCPSQDCLIVSSRCMTCGQLTKCTFFGQFGKTSCAEVASYESQLLANMIGMHILSSQIMYSGVSALLFLCVLSVANFAEHARPIVHRHRQS